MKTVRWLLFSLCAAILPFSPAWARGPIFADTNLLVAAAEMGHATALAEVDAGTTYVTPNQYKEFLNVKTQAQQKKRKAFLATHHVKTFDGADAKSLAATADFKKVFDAVKASMGQGDAALAAFAKATKHEAVTMESRLFNFLTQTRKDLHVPIRRVK